MTTIQPRSFSSWIHRWIVVSDSPVLACRVPHPGQLSSVLQLACRASTLQVSSKLRCPSTRMSCTQSAPRSAEVQWRCPDG